MPDNPPRQGNLPAENLPVRILTVVFLYAVFAALWILLSDKVMEWTFSDPTDFALASTLKGLAFVTVTSLLLYGLMRRLIAPPGTIAATWGSRRQRLVPLGLLIVTILAITGIGIFDSVIRQRDRGLALLETIADHQTRQIEDWLAERYGDARFVQTNQFWIDLYRRWRSGNDPASWHLLRNRMDAFRQSKAFQRILLLDGRGALLWDSGCGPRSCTRGTPTELKGPASVAGRIGHLGPYRDGNDQLHLDFIVPLPAFDSQPGPTIILQVDPADHLFRLLRTWPVPSPSGETVLFRRDGDQVLFLNDLRQEPRSAGRFRQPVAEENRLSAKILRNETGPAGRLSGLDYRGTPVMGVVRAIRGSDWYLMANLFQTRSGPEGP